MIQSILIFTLFLISNVYSQTPTRHWPNDISNVKEWTGYIIFIVLTLVLPFVFLLVIYNFAFCFWCCRKCCGICGGSKASTIYVKNSRKSNCYRIIYWMCLLVVLCGIACSMVFWSFNYAKLTKVTNDTIKFTNKSIGQFDLAYNTVNGLDGIIDSTFKQADNVIQAVDIFNTTFNQIESALDGTQGDVNQLSASVTSIEDHLKQIKDLFAEIGHDSGVENPPDPDSVPSVSQAQQYFDFAINYLQDAKQQVEQGRVQVEQMKENVQENINEYRTDVDKQLHDFQDSMSEPLNTTNYYVRKIEPNIKYLNAVTITGGVVLAIVAILYTIVVLGVLFGFIGICMSSNCSVRMTTAIFFFTAWIFIIIGIINLILFTGSGNVCKEAEPALLRSQPILDKHSIKINISDINNVLHCQDGVTLANLIPDFSPKDLINATDLIGPIQTAVDEALYSIDVSKLTSDALSKISQFQVYTKLMNVNVTEPLIVLKNTKLVSVLNQLTNLTHFGFNEALANQTLDELNEESEKIGGKQFTLDTIDQLNPDVIPYIINRDYFADTKDKLIQFRNLRNDALDRVEHIRTLVKSASDLIILIGTEVATSYQLIQDTSTSRVDSIKTSILSMSTSFDTLKIEAQDAVNYATNTITSLVDIIDTVTSCKSLGNFYSNTKDNVCDGVVTYSGIIMIVSFVIAVVELIGFMLLLPGTKRIGRSEVDADEGETADLIDISRAQSGVFRRNPSLGNTKDVSDYYTLHE
jgi:archaellum component FlaC/uncharacterized membrane protein